jgi:hypothetical protein
VERLFKTVQDRLVKELRLADVSTLEAANQVLESYLPIYNQRFAVQPCRQRICIAPVLHTRS